MKHSINKNYPYLLWIYSVLIGSVFLLIFYLSWYMAPMGIADSFWLFFISTLFSAVFSWLVFLLAYFTFWRLVNKHTPPRRIKVILCLVGILGMLITAAFFGVELFSFSEDLLLPLSYTLGILFATWILKINKV